MSENNANPKKQILLKLLNKILEILKRQGINEITDFNNIPLDDILNIENVNNLFDMESEILQIYNKKDINWYNRKKVKNYLLTFISKACNFNSAYFCYEYNKETKKHDLCKIEYYLQ